MATRLQNRAILLTGSTTDIGEAMPQRLITEGARALVEGRGAGRGHRLVAERGRSAALHLEERADPPGPPSKSYRRRCGRSAGSTAS